MNVTHRSLVEMSIFTLLTLTIYNVYWIVKTKQEINAMGAQIPSAWLFIIPFVNLYFLYRFSEAFSIYVLKNKSQTVTYFLLLTLLWPIGTLVCQHNMNEVA